MSIKSLFVFFVVAWAGTGLALASEAWVADFYAAPTEEERQGIVDGLDLDNYTFEDLYELLANPPARNAEAPTGLQTLFTRNYRGEKYFYTIVVPESYDPQKAYPLVIFLHGDVARNKPKRHQSWWRIHDEMVNEDLIQVFPTAWSEAKWWTKDQRDNFRRIISQTKATYHVDSNKIFMTGISDGATGGFYMSATSPSDYAGYASVIGFPGVLKGKHVTPKDSVYPINMRALKILAINTKHDYLYPVKKMRYYIETFQEIGIDIEFVAYEIGGHDLETFKRALPEVWKFVAGNQRSAYPQAITWQYENDSPLHRVNWLIVEELLPASEQASSLEELSPMKPTSEHSGLIELIQKDNAVAIQNHGVARYTLLLSPRQFDFGQPITLIENETLIHRGLIKPSKKVLLNYAVKDFDPARLYGAEVVIAN